MEKLTGTERNVASWREETNQVPPLRINGFLGRIPQWVRRNECYKFQPALRSGRKGYAIFNLNSKFLIQFWKGAVVYVEPKRTFSYWRK